jgi:hypothetical protein
MAPKATKPTKAMTLRLPTDQIKDLQLIAEIEGRSVTDEIRVALEKLIDARKRDEEFTNRAEKKLREQQQALEEFSRAS